MTAITNTMVQSRCSYCEECDTRWNWASTLHNKKTPVMKHKNKSVYPRRILWELQTGKPIPKGVVIITTCHNPQCCNPDLLKDVSRGYVVQRTADTGVFSSLIFRAKVAEAKRKDSKLPDEAVIDIRSSEESAEAMAKKHNISESYVHMLRKNRFRKQYTNNPFMGLVR